VWLLLASGRRGLLLDAGACAGSCSEPVLAFLLPRPVSFPDARGSHLKTVRKYQNDCWARVPEYPAPDAAVAASI
jgi:hypothetical protein